MKKMFKSVAEQNVNDQAASTLIQRSKWVYILVGCSMAALIASTGMTNAQQPAKAAAVATKEQKAVEKKLKEIMIPVINIENMPLKEAADAIRVLIAKNDVTEKNADAKGINIVIKSYEGWEPRKLEELRLRNVPADVALKYIANSAGMMIRVDEHGVTFIKPDEAKAPAE